MSYDLLFYPDRLLVTVDTGLEVSNKRFAVLWNQYSVSTKEVSKVTYNIGISFSPNWLYLLYKIVPKVLL